MGDVCSDFKEEKVLRVRTQRDAESIWTSVCKKSLSKEVSPLTYNTWFLSAKPYLSGERVFGLAVPSDIAKEYVGQHRPLIENALKDYTRVNYSLEITVRPDGTVPSQEERFSAFEKNGNGNGNFRAGQLNPNYSFSSFYRGTRKQFRARGFSGSRIDGKPSQLQSSLSLRRIGIGQDTSHARNRQPSAPRFSA